MVAAIDVRQSRLDASARGGGAKFRPDIEGLRAVAVGLVLLYHAGLFFLPAGFVGVDVFFVISGFLITGLLVREVERTGRVALGRFYARRARRLLPAAALVLVITAVVSRLTANIVGWSTIGGDIAAAAAYVVNWRLAARSVDYLAEGVAPSPVQHFWSLSVEEQFYVIWPLLLIVLVLLVRRFGLRIRPTMALGLGLIAVPSLVWSVVATAATPQSAFFVTTTRLWELGVGALVAVGSAQWSRIPLVVARVLGWAGLAAIVGSALLIDAEAAWPGALALIPVLGTAAVIVAGSAHRESVPKVLTLRAMVWVGGLSYSLYLWHWPMLIVYGDLFGGPGQKIGLLVVLASVGPAWLSHRYLENPVRFSKRLSGSSSLSLSVGANLTALGVVAGLALVLAVPGAAPNTGTSSAVQGARTLRMVEGQVVGVGVVDHADSIVPGPAHAAADRPAAYDEGCQAQPDAVVPRPCVFGDPDASTRVVLAGDSKALQWIDPLSEIAKREHWRLEVATKSSCAFAGLKVPEFSGVYEECHDYTKALLEQLLTEKPDAVIVSQGGRLAIGPDGEKSSEAMVDGLVDTWTSLEDVGIDVIAIMDNPRPFDIDGAEGQVYACVADHLDDLGHCAFSAAEGKDRSGMPLLRAAADRVPAADTLDMTDTLCNNEVCPAVIGNVLVYRQGSHITSSYALSTEPVLEERLAPLVDKAVATP